jgi:acetate kinase
VTRALVLNAGSSSLKFALLDAADGSRALAGIAERLGTGDAVLTIDAPGQSATSSALDGDDHAAAVSAIVRAVQRAGDDVQPAVVGHRVVHGGALFTSSALVDDDALAAIEELTELAPLHNPPALAGIRRARQEWPTLPQVAAFDTAFHHTIPPHAARYAVPQEWYERHDVRRYGFHGLSVRHVSAAAAEALDRPLGRLAMVVAHLGNGCSATAVLDGRSIDTTMGLTPLEGLMMGTRSGDVDPSLFAYLGDGAGISVDEVTDALNHRSGLLGVSGRSNDMREVATAAAEGDERAELAVAMFCHRIVKAVAALAAAMGRLDAVVFTGGIGENDAASRARVVDGLGLFGLVLDDDANAGHGRDSRCRISRSTSPAALVVPTDEELVIARDAAALIAPG